MSDVSGAAAVETTATETAPTFDATLQGEIDKLFDASEATERRQEQASGQDRSPNGKFQASDGGKPQEGAAEAQPKENQDQVPEPPASWSSLKAHWAALSPEIRQALIDKDTEVQQSLSEHGERLKGYESLEQVIGPRRAALAQGFGSPEAAIKQLFDLSDFAGRDFPGFVRWMCEQRGVDPKSLIAQVAAQPTTDPTITALLRKVDSLEKGLGAREQAEEQETERKALAAIEAFATAKSDKGEPLHPHWDAVKDKVGEYLRLPSVAAAKDPLAEAYRRAVRDDEKLQAKIAAKAEEDRKAREAEEAKEKAAKAKRAASGDLRTGSGGSSASRASFDETLMASIDKALGTAA
jgi:hypothetical protein